MGWLEDRDATNQRRAEAENEGWKTTGRYPEDSRVEERTLFLLYGVNTAIFAVVLTAGAIVLLIVWILSSA